MFSCSSWPFVCLLWRNVKLNLLPFFNQAVWLFMLNCRSFFNIFWVLTSYQRYNLQIFSPILFVDSLLCDWVFDVQTFNFYVVQFIFSFVSCSFSIIFKKSLSNPMFQRFSSILFQSFIVLALMFRSLVHFELIFVHGKR